jgi:hypothetical protein
VLPAVTNYFVPGAKFSVAVAGRVFFEQENKIVLFTKDNSFGMQRIEGLWKM